MSLDVHAVHGFYLMPLRVEGPLSALEKGVTLVHPLRFYMVAEPR